MSMKAPCPPRIYISPCNPAPPPLSPFLFPFALNRYLKPWVCVPFMMSPSSGFPFQGAQKKASVRGNPLGRGRTAVYNGLHVMAYSLTTVRTGVEANPDDPGTSQVPQNLQQLSPKLGKPRFQENTPRSASLLRGRITLLP